MDGKITALRGTDPSEHQGGSSDLACGVGSSRSGLGGWPEFLVGMQRVGLFSPGYHPSLSPDITVHEGIPDLERYSYLKGGARAEGLTAS